MAEHAHDTNADVAPRGGKILVLGHRGMLGSAMVRALGYRAIATVEDHSSYVDLTMVNQTRRLTARAAECGVDTIINCAGLVGGIKANAERPAEFAMANLRVACNVIEMAHALKAKLVYVGSSCIYPRDCEQPMREKELLRPRPLEPTNEAYAWSKLTGIHMCQWYERQYGLMWLAPIPCNLYGPGDRYEEGRCHVIPALIKRFHEAKIAGAPSVTCWGTGKPRREFMHVDDCAAAIVHLVDSGATGIRNVGMSVDQTIRSTAELVAEVVGYQGEIVFDGNEEMDGVPRKLLYAPPFGRFTGKRLRDGIEDAYRDFLARFGSGSTTTPAALPDLRPAPQPLGVATTPSRAIVGEL